MHLVEQAFEMGRLCGLHEAENRIYAHSTRPGGIDQVLKNVWDLRLAAEDALGHGALDARKWLQGVIQAAGEEPDHGALPPGAVEP